MTRPRILILTALNSEARAVKRNLKKEVDVQVGVVGVRGLAWDRQIPSGVDLIILAGMGGALSSDLVIGDLVTDTAEEMNFPAGFVSGRIVCSDSVLADADAKRQLWQKTGAACVDMESDLIRQVATAANVPLIHLRAISDSAADAIDPAVLNLVDVMGRPRPTAIASYVLKNPRRIRDLRRLGQNASVALERLGKGIMELMRILAIFTVLTICLSGCAPAAKPQPPVAATPVLTSQPSTYDYVSDPDGLQFSFPAGWKPVEKMEYRLRLRQDETGPEFTLEVPDLPPHIPGLIPLRLVANGYTDDLKKAHPQMTIESNVDATVAGAKGRRVASSWQDAGKRMFDLAVLCVHGDRVYIFRVAGQSRQDDAAAMLDTVLGSVKWR